MSNIKQLTIKKALAGLKSKEFSSQELVKSYLEKIKKEDRELNAFITVDEKGALEQAKRADNLISKEQNLPLLGIPIALKDIFLTKGIRTTAGSKVLDNYIPQYDSTVVKKLKDAGAVIVGKTNLDAWAHGSSGENSDFGPTKNPYNKDYVPGGSSSGSAVAVSSSMCLAATGTDTGGSIRLPASFTNVVGLKPTYGRVSRYGIIAMSSSQDSIGHFTKTVEDCALILNITAGKDDFDATTPLAEIPDYTFQLNKGINGLKIGVPKEYVGKGLDASVKKALEQSLRIFEKLGAEIAEISLPHSEYANACYYIIQSAEVSSNLSRYDGIRFANDRLYFGDEAKRRIMLGTFTLSHGYYDAYYKKAMRVRTLIKKDFEEAFKKVAVIISPISPTPPWKLGEKVNDPLKMYLSDIFAVAVNLSGNPGLAVPAGFIDKLPTGIQIIGPHFSEDLLFRVGYAYEQNTEWYKKNPVL